MADKKAGGAAKGGKGFSSPAMQAVWIETIHKELRNQKMNTNFHFNPKAFPIITDKVTKSFKEPMDLNTATAAEIVELEKDLRLEGMMRFVLLEIPRVSACSNFRTRMKPR